MMKIYIGERVTLRFRVDNKEGKDFTINSADYTAAIGDNVKFAGPMMVKGHELSFLFNPTEQGIYRISIWYDIESSRRKGEFLIEVIE